MPAGTGNQIDYRTRTLEPWLAPEKPRIVAFISSSDNRGTDLLSGVAAAIVAGDKQVRVLRIDGGDGENEGDIGLLESMGDVADYLLVDLPFRPTPFARSVLADCDLVIVAGSCKIEYLSEAENIVKVLLFLGIDPAKVAGVLVDPEGILSSASLADIKPYLESSLGIEMAGVISFDSASSQMARDIEQLAGYIK
jgi:hypothetical protein